MSRDEMICRLGYVDALALRFLQDASWAEQHICRAETISLEEALTAMAEIQQRLVAVGILFPDEDAWAANLAIPDLEKRLKERRAYAGGAIE